MKAELRYLLEYKASRLVMSGGNLEQSQLRGLIEAKKAFFFKEESRDYERCPHSSALIEEYPEAFLSVGAIDLDRQAAISEKAVAEGLIGKRNRAFAPMSVRLVSLAAREQSCCILAPPTLIIDNFEICKAAAVDAATVADFIQWLKDSADD